MCCYIITKEKYFASWLKIFTTLNPFAFQKKSVIILVTCCRFGVVIPQLMACFTQTTLINALKFLVITAAKLHKLNLPNLPACYQLLIIFGIRRNPLKDVINDKKT